MTTPPTASDKAKQNARFRMGMAVVLGIGVAWLLASSAIDLASGPTWVAFWVWLVAFPILFAVAWRRERKRGTLDRSGSRNDV